MSTNILIAVICGLFYTTLSLNEKKDESETEIDD